MFGHTLLTFLHYFFNTKQIINTKSLQQVGKLKFQCLIRQIIIFAVCFLEHFFFSKSELVRITSGLKRTSICLLLIPSTSHYSTSLFFSNHNPNYSHHFGTQTQKNHTICFGVNLYSAGTQHGNLRRLCVAMNKVTYFIPQAHTGIGVCHSQHRKTRERLWKNAG